MDTLMAHARRGDEQALNELYDMSRTRVFRLALALLGDPGAAEEVMQDSLWYALTHLHQFDAARSAWSTWVHTITVGRCRNYARRRRWMIVPLLHSLMTDGLSPNQLAEIRERTGALHAMLLRLSPKLREAVALRFLEELSFAEMGSILGCSDRTAQSRVRVGIERLRAMVEADAGLLSLLEAR
ncbi:MAG TPA: RNA polymerase sigma factor [Herpetosiphonaceae bacterium]